MSYEKAMRFARKHRKGIPQSYMGFTTLGQNERRRNPWLGSVWYEPGRDEERRQYIQEYHAETERLLRENPSLKIVD